MNEHEEFVGKYRPGVVLSALLFGSALAGAVLIFAAAVTIWRLWS